jgi:hypothetical protein
VIVYLGAIMALTGLLAAGMIALAHADGVGVVLLAAVVVLSSSRRVSWRLRW